MKIYTWREITEEGPEKTACLEKPAAVTVGGFDGMHLGHAPLFEAVLEYKRAHPGAAAGVVTFSHSPGAVKFSSTYAGDISTQKLKCEFFENSGFDFALVIDFSEDFSKIKGRDFLDILRKFCSMQFLAAGYDFRCGHNLDTGVAELADYMGSLGLGFKLCQKIMLDGVRVSSSLIREKIQRAEFSGARRLLGYDYCLDASPFKWEACPSESGLSMIAHGKTTQVLPKDGVYPVRVFAGGGVQRAGLVLDRSGNSAGAARAESCFLRLEFPPEQKIHSMESVEKIIF